MPAEEFTLEQAADEIGSLRQQVDLLSEILAQADITAAATPNVPAAGIIQYSAAGQHSYVSAADGNAYNTGRLTARASSGPALTTTLTTIPGMSAALAVATYRVHAQICLTGSATAGQGALTYRVQGTGGLTAASGRISFTELNAAPVLVAGGDFFALGTTLTGGTPNNANDRVITLDGVLVISVAGTVNIQAAQATTAAVSVNQGGSYLEVFPVN